MIYDINSPPSFKKLAKPFYIFFKDFDGKIKELEANYLLPFFGLAMELGPIANWGLNLNKHNIEVDAATMRTSIEGIYAVGDIGAYKNKLKLLT